MRNGQKGEVRGGSGAKYWAICGLSVIDRMMMPKACEIPGTPCADGTGVVNWETAGIRAAAVFAPQLAELSTISDGFARLSFCVATDGAESRLAPVTPDEAAFAGRYIDLSVADNPDDMDRAMNGEAIGRELWRYAAVPLLLLLLLEILFTRWITEQRRTGEEGRIAFDEVNRPSSRFNEILRAIQNGGRA